MTNDGAIVDDGSSVLIEDDPEVHDVDDIMRENDNNAYNLSVFKKMDMSSISDTCGLLLKGVLGELPRLLGSPYPISISLDSRKTRVLEQDT